MCGALSGAILGISLVKGRNSPEDSIEPAYADIQALSGLRQRVRYAEDCQDAEVAAAKGLGRLDDPVGFVYSKVFR